MTTMYSGGGLREFINVHGGNSNGVLVGSTLTDRIERSLHKYSIQKCYFGL